MKRGIRVAAVAVGVAVLTSVLWAASKPAKSPNAAVAPGVAAAATLSQVTGVAISPLLGVSAVGAYTWFKTPAPERAALPWYARPSFWMFGLLLVAVCALKDGAGAVLPPGWKKPLDVVETLENKVSGLVAVGAFVPFTLGGLAKLLGVGKVAAVGSPLVAGGLATIQVGTIDLSWGLAALMMPLAAAIFLVVWVTSHAITVLILLSPWGSVDAILKGARTAVLGLLTITATINPVWGAVLSVVVILFAWLCAGWAFRLATFGTLFCWDFFTLRRARFRPAANDNWMFAARKVGDAPLRTYGKLHRDEDGRLEFRYRPWLVLRPRAAEVPAPGLAVGCGAFYSTVVTREGEDTTSLFLLPPRYRGHEADLAQACGARDVIDVGLRRAWAWLKDAIGLGSRGAVAGG